MQRVGWKKYFVSFPSFSSWVGATARDQPALRVPLRSARHLPAKQTRPTHDYTFDGVAAGGDESDILAAWDPRRHLAGIPPLQAHRDAKQVGHFS